MLWFRQVVRSRLGLFEPFSFDVPVHVLTCRKSTDVWSIETRSSVLVFATCKPDLTYRVCAHRFVRFHKRECKTCRSGRLSFVMG